MADGFRTEWDSPLNQKYDLWTVTNASEIVPGVLTPLLASWTANAEEKAFRRIIGDYLAGGKVRMFKAPVPNFAGVFAGHIALNMGLASAIYSLVDPAIGEAVLQQFFTGVKGTERFIVKTTEEERAATVANIERLRGEAGAKLDADRERLYAERASDRFQRDEQLGLKAAFARQIELTDDAIELFTTHLHVSFAAGEYQVKLGGVLDMAGQPPELVVPLCSGLGEVESSKPAIGLYDLGASARKVPEIAGALRKDELKSVLARIDSPPSAAWRGFAKAFRQFLFDYGYRVQAEYDPSNPDWNEEPTFALSQVRSMLGVSDAESPRALIKRAVAARKGLEKQIRAAIPSELKPAFDGVLGAAQAFTRMREYSKAMWILGQRRGRAVYLAMSRGLARDGAIRQPDDMKFLLYEEVGKLTKGRKLDGIPEAVVRRKKQFQDAHRALLPDTWTGLPEVSLRKASRSKASKLTGLGVSGGVATGKARIVTDALAATEREILDGEILVAPFTDAPWTPLFIPAGAVVVETGGVLSHAATVAREFGIPCVVMVKEATSRIREGDTVTVDGTAGTVTIERRA